MISKLNQPKSYKKPKQLFIKMPKLILKMVKLVFKMLRLVFKLPKLVCPASHLQEIGWIPPKKQPVAKFTWRMKKSENCHRCLTYRGVWTSCASTKILRQTCSHRRSQNQGSRKQ